MSPQLPCKGASDEISAGLLAQPTVTGVRTMVPAAAPSLALLS
jgi:hypothetical protein